MVELQRLSNGLSVLWAPLAQAATVAVLATAAVGSRHETPTILGMAHCLEHMVFKGTKRYRTARQISQTLDSIGAHYNAYTSKDHTAYYVHTTPDHIDIASSMISEMVFAPLLAARQLVSEKNVIIEEIKMYEDNPLMSIDDHVENLIFAGHPLGRLIIGTRQTVKAVSAKTLRAFLTRHYWPANVAVVVAGQITPVVRQQIIADFSRPTNRRRSTVSQSFASRQKAARTAVSQRPTEQAQVALGWPGVGQRDRRLPAITLLSVILGGTMSSRLFTEVREKRGLAYSIRASHQAYRETGAWVIQAGLDPKKVPQALQVIGREISRIKKTAVSPVELRRAKDYLKGSLAISLEDASHVAEWYARQYIVSGQWATPAERLAEIAAVTAGDIQRVAKKLFSARQMSIAAIGPLDSHVLATAVKHFS